MTDPKNEANIFSDRVMNNENKPENTKQISFHLIYEQTRHIQEIVQNTVIAIQEYHRFNLFSNNEMNQGISSLKTLYEKTQEISGADTKIDLDVYIDKLQTITDELTNIVAKYGTKHIKDVLYLFFGSEFSDKNKCYCSTNCIISGSECLLHSKLQLIEKHVHPIGFKSIVTKTSSNRNKELHFCLNKEIDDTLLIENSPQFECYNVDITENFIKRVNEVKIFFCGKTPTTKAIVISGIIDNINTHFCSNEFVRKRVEKITTNFPTCEAFDVSLLHRQIEAMNIKDILIHGDQDIYNKNLYLQNFVKNIKSMKLELITQNFIKLDMFSKRNQLCDMLLFVDDTEIQYLAYLLYDLLSNVDGKSEDYEDSFEQTEIYNSFSWKTRCMFKDAMKNTVQYNQNVLNKYENTQISIEQQIIFWRVPEHIKEKAFIKLKDFKGRMDDSGSKAKQYLEGLLRIPFETYRKEPVLNMMTHINEKFIKIILARTPYNMQSKLHETSTSFAPYLFQSEKTRDILEKDKYTNTEIYQQCIHILKTDETHIKDLLNSFCLPDIKNIQHFIRTTDTHVENPHKRGHDESQPQINRKSKHSKVAIIDEICQTLQRGDIIANINEFLIKHIINSDAINTRISEKNSEKHFRLLKHLKYKMDVQNVIKDIDTTAEMMKNIRQTLDDSIHGHTYAKKQIMKIICQWMNGKQAGYCFGFEGSPGVGKTSLAKNGLAKCLVDEHGSCRPFSFIALGGSCNGSTLEGHSYTYLNSTWGRIADILMESKCMNPIIYIDELDKVSKSEQGREIFGILTHLIDSTQNDVFQDKYFSGIPLDLSKALFIFSYNDVDQIDRVLLDRIHRIRFDNLTLNEKIVISKKHIIPEINAKMGFDHTVEIGDDVLQYIIESFTSEPGVRKLKEILFDLYGEINMGLLENIREEVSFPLHITVDQVEEYLKKYTKTHEIKIHKHNRIGVINGLWANSLGNGGVIPIETMFYPTEGFLDLKLTGLQGDVMKESMNVAKTLVWSLCSSKQQEDLIKQLKTSKARGIHIHCPEGGVSKDGPSAGAAIVVAIFSLLNKIPIKNDVAITGEISLQGNITAIGGLEHKIVGGIRAGIQRFIFPEENRPDFQIFLEKIVEQKMVTHRGNINFRNNICEILFTKLSDTHIPEIPIKFIMASCIHEIFPHVLAYT